VSGVEAEPSSEGPHGAPFGPDLPQHAVLAERPVPLQIAVVERSDALGHDPVEAPDLIDERAGHSLILVRDHPAGARAV
jgi:hypothetical protein